MRPKHYLNSKNTPDLTSEDRKIVGIVMFAVLLVITIIGLLTHGN